MQKTVVLMTRPAGSNRGFAELLSPKVRRLATFVDCPLIEIVALEAAGDAAVEDAVIFSSANGVKYGGSGQGRRAFCVGEVTTQAAKDEGWVAECAGETASDLIAYVSRLKDLRHLRHFCGVHVRGEIAETLTAVGIKTERTPLYDQRLLGLSDKAAQDLLSDNPVIVPLFSPRAAAHFSRICPTTARPYIVSMSPAIDHAIDNICVSGKETAQKPNAIFMAQSIEKLVNQISLG